MTEPAPSEWPTRVSALTLFVDDLVSTAEFYRQVFGLPVAYQDEASVVFSLGGLLLNFLHRSEAPELVEPATVGSRTDGARFQLTIPVDDVDAVCNDVQDRGVTLLNGPMDRPWGIRTASFCDPDGYIWEIAH